MHPPRRVASQPATDQRGPPPRYQGRTRHHLMQKGWRDGSVPNETHASLGFCPKRSAKVQAETTPLEMMQRKNGHPTETTKQEPRRQSGKGLQGHWPCCSLTGTHTTQRHAFNTQQHRSAQTYHSLTCSVYRKTRMATKSHKILFGRANSSRHTNYGSSPTRSPKSARNLASTRAMKQAWSRGSPTTGCATKYQATKWITQAEGA